MARNPVLAEILRQGRHQPRKRVLSAIETGLVETNLRNLRYGSGSSVNWRQETKSSYPNVNRLDLRGSVARFYQEAARADRRGQSPGQLAQAVQRSAYPGRYDQRAKEAAQLMAKYAEAYAGGSTDTQGVKITAKNELDTAAFEQAKRGYVLGTLLAKHHGPTGPLFKAGLLSTEQPNPQSFMRSVLSSKITHDEQTIPGGKSSDAGNSVQRMLRIATAVGAKKLPYKWGGGHGSSPAPVGTPVDCSGYVSQILGVSPRVSGQFASSWGKPGRGKQVTVYAHSSHVLIQIGNRWFATSRSNPGGGAGEISKPSASYLKAFRARHPAGL